MYDKRNTTKKKKPRKKYINQIMKDVGGTFYREIKDMTKNRENKRKYLL
jgi:hypothetical protein